MNSTGNSLNRMPADPPNQAAAMEQLPAAAQPPHTRSERQYNFGYFKKRDGDVKNNWERAVEGGVTTLARSQHFTHEDATSVAVRQPTMESPTANDQGDGPSAPALLGDDESHKLGELPATAIAGNDITSSCLYSAGITLAAGGIMAPFSSVILCFTLYLFRDIYSEVCTGLPMNGGTYNALLNTTSKSLAALASVLSLVSYTATAVTSAASAAEYLHYQWDVIPVVGFTLAILVFFALLNLLGISESANAASFMFIVHMVTMAVLGLACLVYVIRDNGETMARSFRNASVAANPTGNQFLNLFYGYCAALLGITGFETSANYIEEQKHGIFPKTLRNMWIAVSVLNPVLTILAVGVLDIEQLVADQNYCLAAMAMRSAGPWLKYLVIIDGTMVLSGAVLTAYVGVGGLLRRMAFDQLMPTFFTITNKLRGSNHWIIVFFCILTSSLRLLVNDMNTLGGVYAIAFLGVMALFTIANLAVKFKRAGLPRYPITPVPQVVGALLFVIAGMAGNLVRSKRNAEYFVLYFLIFAAVVIGVRLRVDIMRMFISVSEKVSHRVADFFRSSIGEIREQPVIFFTKSSSISRLNKMIMYVLANEDTNRIFVVHCTRDTTSAAAKEFLAALEMSCATLDRIYPKLTIALVVYEGNFDPDTVAELSKEFDVSRNFMFITCPGNRFPHNISRFGGLRVVSY